ncbi:TetR/AcrR family transcriptional regulator [Clostridium tagluense]|uniref:TetR/AcrR family transcriptional regulator n=1 Tax=Clostridium tagluense TaxID=360422 RepID=UPI001CF189F6|nr:TetR/AcrR family transcriptional regulator [Clostridium tagluense]MCB2297396.1 TetR/AcrR family transcriptional regulator [Clostridium tagluense]
MKIDILKRKDSIIITAIEVLYEAGINGMTIKEIAKRQNISEPAIYRHFNGKREIIKEILRKYSIYDEVIKNTILDNNMSGKESIKYFCRAYAEYYQNYPEITTVMFSFDIFKYDEDANKKMKNIIKNRYDLLFGFVSKAIDKKEVSLNKDIQALTDSIFSILWTTTFLWRMKNCSFDVKERILLAVNNIIDF